MTSETRRGTVNEPGTARRQKRIKGGREIHKEARVTVTEREEIGGEGTTRRYPKIRLDQRVGYMARHRSSKKGYQNWW